MVDSVSRLAVTVESEFVSAFDRALVEAIGPIRFRCPINAQIPPSTLAAPTVRFLLAVKLSLTPVRARSQAVRYDDYGPA